MHRMQKIRLYHPPWSLYHDRWQVLWYMDVATPSAFDHGHAGTTNTSTATSPIPIQYPVATLINHNTSKSTTSIQQPTRRTTARPIAHIQHSSVKWPQQRIKPNMAILSWAKINHQKRTINARRKCTPQRRQHCILSDLSIQSLM